MRKAILAVLLLSCSAFAQFSSGTAKRIIQGTPKPATCAVGDVWVDTTASPATNYSCLTLNTWTVMGGGAGTTINATNNVLPKRSNATTFVDSSITDNGTTVSISEPVSLTGATAGVIDFPQGVTNVGSAPCTVATSICEQAPTAVTSYALIKPGVGAQGNIIGTLAGSTVTQGISGDANHSTVVTTGSATSITSTSLCSTTFCPAGTYRINAYLDITTPCGTSGTYSVSLVYTDDQGSKTVVIPMQGTGETAGVLTTTAAANFGQAAVIVRSTGSVSINYLTTAVACGTAGPMVGKLYLSVEAVQ